MWFTPHVDSLVAVAVAELDENGVLLNANAGFLRLIQREGENLQLKGARVARFFIQPDFATLITAQVRGNGEIYKGIVTIGDYSERTWSLHSRIWHLNARLYVLAEHDIEELEKLHNILIELNRDYAKAQFELVQINHKLQQREAQILALSLTDPLTGVGNRRRLDQELEQEINRSERTGESLCVLMTDLDYFKKINDTYGHDIGDKVLTVHVQLLRQHIRPMDTIIRFGGEEFIILMPHTDIHSAQTVAERIRLELAGYPIEPLVTPVTVSIGVAELLKDEPGESLLRRVDAALYEAKNLGRNQVVVAKLDRV